MMHQLSSPIIKFPLKENFSLPWLVGCFVYSVILVVGLLHMGCPFSKQCNLWQGQVQSALTKCHLAFFLVLITADYYCVDFYQTFSLDFTLWPLLDRLLCTYMISRFCPVVLTVLSFVCLPYFLLLFAQYIPSKCLHFCSTAGPDKPSQKKRRN